VERFLRRQTDLAISDLVEVELVSTIARKVRRREMRRVDAQRAQAMFLGHLDAGFYARWPISRAHFSAARHWLSLTTLPLLALDALHLSVAAAAPAPIATVDANLARAARALGLGVRVVPS
jgi:predicted nucleic acid-binding protein